MADMRVDTTGKHPAEADAAQLEILTTARKRFRLVCDAENEQRRREREDLMFQVPELQWDPDAKNARLGNLGGIGTPIPPRPCLSIPQLLQPVSLVLNQERNAHLGVNVHPISEDSDDETAEVIQGLYRDIERRSRAYIARTWAFERAVEAGRGFYRVNTRWDDEGGTAFDQMVTIERILDQEQVYLDPSAQEPDWSDGRWAFITRWWPAEVFKKEFPNAPIPRNEDFASDSGDSPLWVRGSGEGAEAVLIAEYFERLCDYETVVQLADGTEVPAEQAPKGSRVVQSREREVIRVIWRKITGSTVLEEQEWNGRFIPIIPVIGRELQPFDEQRRWHGMIRPARDAQKIFNYAASQAVEMAALEPKAPFIVAEGQVDDAQIKDMWQQANIRNFPYLPYKPTTVEGGQMAPPPQRAQVDAGRMSASMALLQSSSAWVQAATAISDPALGRLSEQERSGKAIMALQSQSDASTSNFLANMAQISMTYEAKVVLDLLPTIYARPGRIARILDEEDNAKTVALNAPFQPSQKGRPQVLGTVANGQMTYPAELPEGAKMYDLSKGRYGVSVTIGKSFQTRLQQGADEMGQILQAAPEMMMLIGDLYFRYRDFPSARAVAERMKKVIAQKSPGLIDEEGQEPSPEQMKAMLTAAQQRMQELQAQLQAAAEELKTEQAKQQATLQKAEMDNQTRTAVAQLTEQTRKAIEGMKAEVDLQIERMKIQAQADQAAQDRLHERALKRVDVAVEMKKAEASEEHAERAEMREDAREAEDAEA